MLIIAMKHLFVKHFFLFFEKKLPFKPC